MKSNFNILHADFHGQFIRFLKQPRESIKTVVKISRELDLRYELVDQQNEPREVLACKLPVWYLPKQKTCIAGEETTLYFCLLILYDGKACAR